MVIDHHIGTNSLGCHGFCPLWLAAAAWIVNTSATFSTLSYPGKPGGPIPQEDAGLTAHRKHIEELREHAVKLVFEMRDRVRRDPRPGPAGPHPCRVVLVA